MSNYKVILPIVISLILSMCSGCSIMTKKDNIPTNTIEENLDSNRKSFIKKVDSQTNIYIDNRFKFSVEYPEKWEAKIEDFSEASIGHNSSPDGGITIYVNNNKDETMYVYGQFGHLNFQDQGFKGKVFDTKSGLKGNLFSKEVNGREEIFLILTENFLGAHLNISSECFNQNKEEIMNVLKSINVI